jgi:hypothetical protein
MERKSTRSGTPASAQNGAARELTHDETLAWVINNRAWRRARKTKPIWARTITAEEIGKEFQTADQAIEIAREGAWLCVGVANEPWFQSLEKIESKYERGTVEIRQFEFDDRQHEYQRFHPKSDVVNWAACVEGSGIDGFSIRPGYDPSTLLHSKAGGYVVRGEVVDPYQVEPEDVWLVQQALFESTYEFVEE